MKVKTYASIYIGTYETSLRIYEINPDKRRLKLLDDLRLPIVLAHDVYNRGKIEPETVDLLIRTLSDMKQDIVTYMADVYEVYITYMLRRAKNIHLILDQIKRIFPENVRFISNSEQRYCNYEALANVRNFDEMISDSALIVDVGGSSLQFTLFKDGKIVTSQHMALGASMLMENLLLLSEKNDGPYQLAEMINKEIDTFANMYFSEMNPKYLILFNATLRNSIRRYFNGISETVFSKEKKDEVLATFAEKSYFQRLVREFTINDPDRIHIPFILLFYSVVKRADSEYIVVPDLSTHEGFTYRYAIEKKILKSTHDFDEDVISASWEIAGRYHSYKPHLKMLEGLCAEIFDSMKKQHGLSKRHRLFIRVAAILHDCGKYINLYASGESTYRIIMSAEIIGLTHDERKLIALVCANNHAKDLEYDRLSDRISEEEYIVFLKLLAILRVGNALDRSHKQKLKNVRMQLKDGNLLIRISAKDSLNLEKGMFDEKAVFFEEVFGIRPIIVDKKL